MDKDKILEGITEPQQELVKDLIDKIEILERDLKNLQKLPHILVSAKKSSVQKLTPAGKLYKDKMNLYLNFVKTLATITRQNGLPEEDELTKALKAFQEGDGDE